MEFASLAMYGRRIFGNLGLDVARQDTSILEPEFGQYLKMCSPCTMVSRERLYAHFQAINYVVSSGIEGDIVECGVWRGGTSMLGALTLLGRGETSRKIWLYDTFAGMTEPDDVDVSPWSATSAGRLWRANMALGHNKWCFAPLEDVQRNLLSTGYPAEKIEFVKGDVAETLLHKCPEKIAVLRLDTDWYESTKIEMEVLFPKLVRGGVILIDDYGAWKGCKKAIDEYLAENKISLMLHRTDYTGRSAVKL
ncbi:TylF/MycF/NovP-related O-methyltransferase [Bradyrhizobium yuanmingense]|uniref:TylF/MycF/NovP-related O-methyltransferase n=1 Tax=Bradyrhizobium yuanmingense TaxID=108015 RepID=UPI0023B8D159|nr:TylF/MycF/NovP-related O-methyltransferase [Bradyrhizobium yuanmingense]MDF0497952.1 macrocin O-methyltransferase [Bradyrhizobium yuanmingense]